MKFVEKDKPVRTIPKGVWESSRPKDSSGKESGQNISSSGGRKNFSSENNFSENNRTN